MEGLMTFTCIVMIAFAILQIILFFKIWGMTTDAKRIWKKMNSNELLSEACVAYLKGDIESTERLANEAFLQEVAYLAKSEESLNNWTNGFWEIKKKYARIFKKIEKPAPDFDKYSDPKIYLL